MSKSQRCWQRRCQDADNVSSQRAVIFINSAPASKSSMRLSSLARWWGGDTILVLRQIAEVYSISAYVQGANLPPGDKKHGDIHCRLACFPLISLSSRASYTSHQESTFPPPQYYPQLTLLCNEPSFKHVDQVLNRISSMRTLCILYGTKASIYTQGKYA